MKVQILRLVNRRRRYKADGKSSTLDKGYVRGFVDGFLVTCTEGKGWTCSCLDDQCEHPDALAAVLHPDALAMLEGDDEPDPKPRASGRKVVTW
ncbi:MAG TPA: hypothetical protein VGE38_03555 [Nocardioides sp.]|uniref:hypothetical protein n=1 Tax=Nocardioides sp. TaxID=35761 RepID=UPI002EDB07AE